MKDPVDALTTSSLYKNGFTFLGNLEELLSKGLPKLEVLRSSGVYAISLPKRYIPKFIKPDEAKKKKNVINPWEVSELKNKWVDGVEIIYYGAAGISSHRSLKKRLNDLRRHGNGKAQGGGPHTGGEILWQLSGYEKFGLWAKATENPQHPEFMNVN